MSTNQKEQNNEDIYTLQKYAENDPNKPKSSELVERSQIPNSPFHIIGNKELGYFLAMGQFRMSQNYKTEDELFEEIDKIQWNLIADMICTLSEQVYKKLKEKGE